MHHTAVRQGWVSGALSPGRMRAWALGAEAGSGSWSRCPTQTDRKTMELARDRAQGGLGGPGMGGHSSPCFGPRAVVTPRALGHQHGAPRPARDPTVGR